MTQTRRWVVGTAIAVVVILAAGWFLLAKPQESKVSSLHSQTAAQQQANALLLTKISALQAEQKQLPQQQLVLQKFSTEIPDNAAEPTLIRQLSSAAAGAGVDLSAITPGSAAPLAAPVTASQSAAGSASGASQTLLEMPLSLAVSGTYANIESFFNSLEHLPRALLVQAFSLAPASSQAAGSGANQLSASLTAAVFYAPGTAPPPPVATPTPQSTAPAPTPASGLPATPSPPAAGGAAASPAVSHPPINLPANN